MGQCSVHAGSEVAVWMLYNVRSTLHTIYYYTNTDGEHTIFDCDLHQYLAHLPFASNFQLIDIRFNCTSFNVRAIAFVSPRTADCPCA